MILIIDNYDSFTYNLYQVISLFADKVIVVRNDKITIDEIKLMAPTGIVLSPGPGRPENAGICVDIVRTFHNKIPILGICLGLQAIAIAFGSIVEKAVEVVHGKSSLIFHNRKSLYNNMPLPFEAGRYHSLIVERNSLSKDLEIEAQTSDETVMGLKHRANHTYGVQFHPESILSENGKNIIENFILICNKR